MEKQIINDNQVIISEVLRPFTITNKPSSNVDYFGVDIVTNRLFVQFKNGSSYIYREVPLNVLKEMQSADSVGKYFSANIAGKYLHTKYTERLVNIEAVLG